MTIVEAIEDVLLSTKTPLTLEEIYRNIIEWNLYDFKADNPKGALARTLRKHTIGYKEPSGNFAKIFGTTRSNESKKLFFLLPNNQIQLEDNQRAQKSKPPKGCATPQSGSVNTTVYHRSRKVRDWVISHANGKCESCSNRGPFQLSDGSWFLEVHHVKHLSLGGSDTVENCVALCPNCHREIHISDCKDHKIEQLYNSVIRLKRE